MSGKTRLVEDTLESIHLPTLAVAGILFAVGLSLSGPTTFTVTSLSSFIAFNSLFQQFISGLLVIAAFVLAFAKKLFGLPITVLVSEAKSLAVGATLWTIGMLFVGIGNANGFTPLGIIASVIGYAILLVSLVLAGTIGIATAASSAKK